MTSTDSLNTLATVECPSSERLKHYLSGWLSDGDAEQLEQHLHACEHCESAMRQLDVHQETLLQSLQATMVQEPGLLAASAVLAMNGSPDSSPADPSKGGSAVIDEALSKARRLLDTPLEAENDPKPVAWHPTHRDFGCYELLRPLGRGGMGAVYLARHRQLGKQVAIKLLPVMSAEDSDVRTRFDREIRVVGRLNHPSIVAATDAGEIEGTQFLVMEYVPGLDLSRLARLMGRLPVAEACELIRQASLGLSCAHAEGVVHRDIKPSNLMLDDLGRIRILDFGLAQWTVWDEASVDLTTVGQLMGTLDYMAPEQAEAIGAVDYRADLYALGATLFRLLCGRAPLAAAPNQSPLEKLRLLSNHQPPKLSTLCPEAPEELVKLVASLLSRNPSDRPASAAHVAEQLAPFAEGAKLVELLQQAKEKAAASPELLKRTALYEPPFPGSAVPMSPPEPAASSGGRFKTLRRLLLAASLPLMIVAGILIKLELNKGQLIIESDVDNVNVKVLKDGKPVDGIQVNHGTTSTRLYADNYEITIDGPSDGLIIDHDKFTLKNGETVVARIKQVPRMENEPGSEGSSQPGGTVFDGKPLEYWLTVIENERSIERLRSAFGACSVLLTEDTAGLITEKVLAALPEVSPTKLKLSATSDEIRQLDLLAFRLVSLANPGEKWITVMVRELDKHDDSWQSRVVSHLWLNSEADRLSDKNLLPLVEWARIKLAAETVTDAVGRVRAAEGLLRIIQREEAPGDLSSKCVAILDAETTLPLSWWFAKPLRYPEGQSTVGLEECWPNPLHHTVVTRAVNALNDGKLPGQELGHALVILKQAETLSPEQKVVLLNCVKRQLVERSASADRLTEFVPVSPSFTLLCVPEVGLSFHVSLPRPPGLCLISFELLNLLQQLDPLSEDADTIQCVRNALPKVEPIFQKLNSSFFSSRRVQPPRTAWPELAMNGKEIDRIQLATYLIQMHPLMKANQGPGTSSEPVSTGDEQITDADRVMENPPATPRDSQKATMSAPLYNGQPLEHWLDMIGRERSVEGLKVAFEACDALVSKENSPIITETLLKFLPVLDGELKLLDKEANRYWTLDYEAARLLWKANPGAQFFTLWVKERSESKDEKWKQRLDQYATYCSIKSADDVQPFVEWARFVLSGPKSGFFEKDGHPDPAGVQSSANLLRGMLNNDKLRADETFVSTATEILTESPYLGDKWWLSEPLLHRGPQGDRELWPAAFQQNVVRKAIVALQSETDPALVSQACMILANGVKLDREETDKVLQAVQKRIEQIVKTPEFFAMVHVPESFSSFAVTIVDTKDALKIGTIQLSVRTSMVQFIPVTDTSLAIQLLNVIASLNGRTTCEPQCRMVLEATRGVFDRVRVRYDERAARLAESLALGTGRTGRTPVQLLWPELTRTDSDQGQGKRSEVIDSRVKDIWGDHSPTQSDWLQLLILNHSAMENVVTAELEKSVEQKPEATPK